MTRIASYSAYWRQIQDFDRYAAALQREGSSNDNRQGNKA